jgi:3-oxoacyl-[acyl-carrier-protein] synthase II
MSKSAAVITGFGAISPLGLTSEQMWAALCTGRCGIGPITAFDPSGFGCKIAGQVPDFKVGQYMPKSYRKASKLFSRDIELAVVAAYEAIVNSGLVTKGIDQAGCNVDPTRIGINLGAGLISCDLVELAPAVAKSVTNGKFDIRKWGKEGIEMVTPLWLLKYLPNMLACHIGIIHDIQGPSNTITCAEISSHLAISEGLSFIERGCCDIVLAGGAEAKVNPIVLIRQMLLKRATTEKSDDPAGACRPFDADAAGSVFGEAAALVVLENPKHAQKRGARIYAEIAGSGQSSCLNYPYESLEPNGEAVAIAIDKALTCAQIRPDDLDLIIPHGTGIPADDLAEARGIETALGAAVGDIAVWPTKSMLSNTGAAGGALDVIAAAYAINDGMIPASRNCKRKFDGCNLNIVTQTIRKALKYVLCCSYTYGGQTAAVILKKPG